MVQSLSCEANWFAASQEIPRISRNPKVHYRTHKRPTPVSILGQPKVYRIKLFSFFEIICMKLWVQVFKQKSYELYTFAVDMANK